MATLQKAINQNFLNSVAVVKHIGYQGFDAALVTPEEYDVSLRRAPSE